MARLASFYFRDPQSAPGGKLDDRARPPNSRFPNRYPLNILSLGTRYRRILESE